MKPPYATGSVPCLSGHAIAYRWRSLPRVRRHRASKSQGSSERVLPWQVTMDQLIFASLSHAHYWYEVGMLKVPAVYGGTDGEGKPLYGTALMASGPAALKHKSSVGDRSVTVLVDSGASGHYFDDLIIPSLKHRLLKYILLTTPRKILTARRALLDGKAERILQGLVTDNHRDHNFTQIAILIVRGIGRNLFSIRLVTKKGVVSIFDLDSPRIELSGIIVPLRAEDDDLYSFCV